MSATGVQSWSKTAAANASSDSAINWAEGQAPSSVNDSARAMMASTAKFRDDINGSITTSGTSTAFTASSNQGFASESAMDGAKLALKFSAASGASPTLAVDGLTARALQTASGTAIPTGIIKSGSIWDLTFVNSIPAWIVHGVPQALPSDATIPDGSVTTAKITDANVTYAKIQNVATNRLLGNFSGGAAAMSEYALTGPTVSGSTITFPAPLPGGFSNLSIKVASNTTVTCAADYVVLTDGTNYKTFASPSGTINLGTNGAANTLDSGVIAIDTWYAIHCIGKSDGTVAWLASTSASSPTLPSGYTFAKRFGWVRTIHASATLYGTWQLGKVAQYVVGLAQTSVLPNMANGTAGNSSTPTYASISVSNFVPTTASKIRVVGVNQYTGSNGAAVGITPNSSYNNIATTNPPLWFVNGGTAIAGALAFEMLLESTNIYWFSSGAGGAVNALGWEDNI